MQIFVSGTGTNIGKTLVCSWLCLHTGYSYFKPIQTGLICDSSDTSTVRTLTQTTIYPEKFSYQQPLSPHLAASLENQEIDMQTITLPDDKNLIVEGAGGLLVPINKKFLMIDLIKQLQLPVILVVSSSLGTINHTLLSLEALRNRNIDVLGIIMNGELNYDNQNAIEHYGGSTVLASIPNIHSVDTASLQNVPFPKPLQILLLTK